MFPPSDSADTDRTVRTRLARHAVASPQRARPRVTDSSGFARQKKTATRVMCADRWCYAAGDLTRSKRVDQHTDRSFMRSERLPKSSLHPPRLACAHIPRFRRATVLPAVKAGAHIKSP